MRQISDFSDRRIKGYCVHCGSQEVETRDHVPPKALLDDPLPENLPVVPSCAPCNSSFARDEQYLACLLECAQADSVQAVLVKRPKVARALAGNARLSAMLASARQEIDGVGSWVADSARIDRVLVKMARGHAAFELNEPQINEPTKVQYKALVQMSEVERDAFEQAEPPPDIWPEVGSRALSRLLIVGCEAFAEGWLVVQPGRYRYNVSASDSVRIRMVISEYLACEVSWNNNASSIDCASSFPGLDEP